LEYVTIAEKGITAELVLAVKAQRNLGKRRFVANLWPILNIIGGIPRFDDCSAESDALRPF